MKTSKMKFFIPILAVVFAVTSAFSTSGTSDLEASASINGYIDAPAPCMTPIVCSPVGSQICTTTSGQQAFGKLSPNSPTCLRVVYKN